MLGQGEPSGEHVVGWVVRGQQRSGEMGWLQLQGALLPKHS